MKGFLKWRHDFMVNNPNTSGVIGFIKGVIVAVIIYEYLLS